MSDSGACCSAQDTYIPARGKAVVKTGLSIAIPAETYARIAPRSGLAVKHFIDTGAGVVDEDYRGEVGVVLFNHSNVDFQGELPVTSLILVRHIIHERYHLVIGEPTVLQNVMWPPLQSAPCAKNRHTCSDLIDTANASKHFWSTACVIAAIGCSLTRTVACYVNYKLSSQANQCSQERRQNCAADSGKNHDA